MQIFKLCHDVKSKMFTLVFTYGTMNCNKQLTLIRRSND